MTGQKWLKQRGWVRKTKRAGTEVWVHPGALLPASQVLNPQPLCVLCEEGLWRAPELGRESHPSPEEALRAVYPRVEKALLWAEQTRRAYLLGLGELDLRYRVYYRRPYGSHYEACFWVTEEEKAALQQLESSHHRFDVVDRDGDPINPFGSLWIAETPQAPGDSYGMFRRGEICLALQRELGDCSEEDLLATSDDLAGLITRLLAGDS